MDFTTVKAVVNDLNGRILPSRFEKAQQADGQTLQLGFRTLQGMVWLELSWKADCPRLTQIPAPPKQGSGSTLAQQTQHSLRQLALVAIAQEGFERVVSFHFASRPGDPVQRQLVLELMGRHSNLLLLDERHKVIAIGRQVRDHQSRVRPISTGDPYAPPPPLQGRPPEDSESFERWRQRLSLLPLSLAKALPQAYQGISPALARQLAGELVKRSVDSLSADEWLHLHTQWLRWLACLKNNRFALHCTDATTYQVWGEPRRMADANDNAPLSLALGRLYRDHLQNRELQRQSDELRQQLAVARQREQEQLQEQENRLQATENADALQQQADGLLCLAAPSRKDIDASQTLYRRAKKLRRAIPQLEERIRHHQQRLSMIDGSEAFLDDVLATDWDRSDERISRLNALQLEAKDLLAPRQRRQTNRGNPRPTPQPLELQSPGGLIIQVGRNHRQNDRISLRLARAGDLWFHAQECPGSHVVLKASNGLAEDSDLTLATDLAAFFSRARGNRRVPVVMVPVEQLQRIVGAGPGTVRHQGGSVRWGEPERAQQQLKAGELLA
ncbi:MAG: Rqc2 family fibronectin-binding protein [Synechococcus sp.]